MANKSSKPFEIRGIVRGGTYGGRNAWVFGTVLDLELVKELPEYTSVPVLCGTQANELGEFVLEVPERFVVLLGPDREAQVLVHAVNPSSEAGASFAQLKADQPISALVIELGTYGAPSKEPVEVQFSNEVLDALLGAGTIGGATSGATSAATAVFDDRFFEDRLRRLVGANVRSGDIAGLRREIDRVVVEEVVEGEPQFVFRGPGSPRPARAKTNVNGGSAVANGRPPGHPAANGNASGYPQTNAGGQYGGSGGGDNLAGGQAILYRRIVAEIDYAREALASLQPVDPLESPQFEAVRGLVGDGMNDLLDAFGNELRPPVARVDGVFADLLTDPQGAECSFSPPDRCFCGFVGELGLQAGILNGNRCFDQEFIETVADERAVTRFLELATFLSGLFEQWLLFRDEFTTAFSEPTLTSLGAILTRRLGLVADATRELDLAIETSPGDSGERFFAEIGGAGTTLDEFISWLNDYVGDSREQLQDASRVGFQGIRSEAKRLVDVTEAALAADVGPDAIIRRRLVRRALEELRTNLAGITEAISNGG